MIGIYNENTLNIKKNLSEKLFSLQFLPEKLQDITNTKKVKYNNITLKVDYLIDITHNLILKYYFKKVNLFKTYSLILKEKYGSKYNHYISYLLSNGIIEMVKNYEKGVNARIYKLNDKILKGKIFRYKNTDKILLKKYRSALLAIANNDIGKNLIGFDVKKKLVNDLFSVSVDFARSLAYLKVTDISEDIFNKNLYSVESIRDNHIFYHFDSYGRVHTNFTILKSFIRKNCLFIDGEETYEKDLSNSQPRFLIKLIEEFKSDIIDSDEFKLFKILVNNGNYYQYLMDNLNINKKQSKDLTYKIFFGKNSKKSKSDKIYKSLFPLIHLFIDEFKRKYGDYRILSHTLQKMESNLIFNKVIKELMDIYPDIKVITVHDSIICQKKYKDVLNYVFDKKIQEEF